MSVEATAWVFDHSEVSSSSHRLVMLAIADFHGDNGAWPKVSTLARRARVGERTVQRAIAEAVRLGELTVQYGTGPGGRNLYELTAILAPRQSDTPPPVSPTPATRDTPTTKPKEPSVVPTTSLRSVVGRDETFEILFLAQTGRPYDKATPLSGRERSKINAAAKDARQFTPDQLVRGIAGWPAAMGDARITALGLVANLTRCINASEGTQFSTSNGTTLVERARALIHQHERELT